MVLKGGLGGARGKWATCDEILDELVVLGERRRDVEGMEFSATRAISAVSMLGEAIGVKSRWSVCVDRGPFYLLPAGASGGIS